MASLSLNFPQPLAEKYRPHVISDFVGLETPKKIACNLVANPKPCALLFIGPSGVGKTSLALAIAESMPAELHHIPSQNCTASEIERVIRICHYVPATGKRMHLVLVDEADRMTDGAQVSLLSKMDATAFPPNTLFIFTCNSADGLEKRFLSRCMKVPFTSYGLATETATLLQRIWDAETDNPIERPNFARIVKDSCNNVRDALMQLEVAMMSA